MPDEKLESEDSTASEDSSIDSDDETTTEDSSAEERESRDSLVVGLVKEVNERLKRRREVRESTIPDSGAVDLDEDSVASALGAFPNRESGVLPVHRGSKDLDEAGVA